MLPRPASALSALKGANLRTRVFIPVFVLACLIGLAYVFSRPPVYLSQARLQLEPPRSQRADIETDRTASLLTAAQTLTSGSVLETLLGQLRRTNPSVADTIASVDALKGMLSAAPVSGTNVIELQGEGPNREALPVILDAWIDIYRRSQSDAYDRSSGTALSDARTEVQELQKSVSAKRTELAEFRKRADIVSLEREENQASARLKGLNNSLNDARTREVNAEARVNAVRENAAAGKAAVTPADRALIQNLERRAMDLREKMKDFEHEYTKSYLELDPRYRALRASLVRTEQDIERERQMSTKQSLQTAEEELTSARTAVSRLQGEIASRKREVQEFTTRFAELTAFVNELKRMDESLDGAKQRLAQLTTESKAAAGPTLTVLSQPLAPERPARPDYWRDALIVVGAAGLLGLIAVWFIEFFQRPVPVQQPPQVFGQPMIHIAYNPNAPLDRTLPAYDVPVARLPETVHADRLPRELSGPEVYALWRAAGPDARLVVAALFGGLTIDELVNLRYDSVDVETGRVYLGATNRSTELREPLKELLKERMVRSGAGPALSDTRGAALSVADLEGLITLAACDAGLANPAEVSSHVLRHTYLAYLVRQGVRFADLPGIIGYVAPSAFSEYGRLSPSGPGLSLEHIDPVFPALRGPAV